VNGLPPAVTVALAPSRTTPISPAKAGPTSSAAAQKRVGFMVLANRGVLRGGGLLRKQME
jgi:hypothetical protein